MNTLKTQSLNFVRTGFMAVCSLAFAAISHSQTTGIEVKDAWVRTSVQGQKATGAFMNITAKDGAKLVGVSSPVAGLGEVHEMKMEGDVMKMRAITALDLPAGKTVALKPGGFHVMLMDLKTPLKKDSTIPLTLRFKDAQGKESTLDLQVNVSTQAPGGASSGSMPGHMPSVQTAPHNPGMGHKH
jgi:copper(I)-binding protein